MVFFERENWNKFHAGIFFSELPRFFHSSTATTAFVVQIEPEMSTWSSPITDKRGVSGKSTVPADFLSPSAHGQEKSAELLRQKKKNPAPPSRKHTIKHHKIPPPLPPHPDDAQRRFFSVWRQTLWLCIVDFPPTSWAAVILSSGVSEKKTHERAENGNTHCLRIRHKQIKTLQTSFKSRVEVKNDTFTCTLLIFL